MCSQSLKKRMARAKRGASYLTPAQFDEMMSSALGGHGWKARLCQIIDVQPSAVTRWCSGENPIPKWLAVIALTLQTFPPEMLHRLARTNPVEGAEFLDDKEARRIALAKSRMP